MIKANFTASRIRAFKCTDGKEQDFLWDAATPGLGLRATANGAKAYVFQSRINGKTYRPTIGDPDTWSIPQAQAEARRLKVMIDNGKDPREVEAIAQVERGEKLKVEAIAQAKQSLLARTVWNAYLAAPHPKWGELHRKDHLIASSEGGIDCKIGNRKSKPGVLATLLSKPIHDITAPVVQDWLTEESTTRQTSAHNAYRKFRTFIVWCTEHHDYKHAVHADCCLTSAVKNTVPKSKTKEGDSLQCEQLPLWFSAVRQISNPVISAYLQGLLITGARRNELTTLRWADVDFRWEKMTIRDKVEGARTIPLTPHLSGLLAALPRYNEWVFSSPGAASGHIESPSKAHTQALATIGLPHVSLQGLRRSFGTLSEWVECPVGVVAQIMGHKPTAIAEKHYIRRSIGMLQMWHGKIETWILEQSKANETITP